MESTSSSLAQARDRGLLQREVPNGLLVYDEERHQTHNLNQTAALVWAHCDGKTSVLELAALLHQQFALPADAELVWLALDRLEKAKLLREPLARPADAAKVSRRAVIRKLGLAGALAALLPLVDSMTSPAAAKQISKGNNGVGNGLDPQPPGDPPINDGTGTSPGNPGNKGGP